MLMTLVIPRLHILTTCKRDNARSIDAYFAFKLEENFLYSTRPHDNYRRSLQGTRVDRAKVFGASQTRLEMPLVRALVVTLLK